MARQKTCFSIFLELKTETWSHSSVVLAVCFRSLLCWKVTHQLSLRFHAFWNKFFLMNCIWWGSSFPHLKPLTAAEKLSHSMMLPLPCFTVGMALAGDEQCLGSPDSFYGVWSKDFTFVLSGQRASVISMHLANSTQAVASIQSHYHKYLFNGVLLVVVLLPDSVRGTVRFLVTSFLSS